MPGILQVGEQQNLQSALDFGGRMQSTICITEPNGQHTCFQVTPQEAARVKAQGRRQWAPMSAAAKRRLMATLRKR